MEAAPVILKMDLHCLRCARKIRKLIKGMYGVQDAWVSLDTGYVVVAGPFVDATFLRWQIQRATGGVIRIDVTSDGGTPAEEAPPENGQMVHLGPPPQGYGGYPAAYGGYGGYGGWVPVVPQYSAPRQYVPNEAPACLYDDNPNGCCIMQ